MSATSSAGTAVAPASRSTAPRARGRARRSSRPGSAMHRAEQPRALLAARALEARLPRVVRAAPRRVGQRALEVRTVVEQRVVPLPRRDALARGLLAPPPRRAARSRDRARRRGRRTARAGRRCARWSRGRPTGRPKANASTPAAVAGPMPGSARSAASSAGQRRGRLPPRVGHDLLGGALECDRAAVVAETLPRLEHGLERCGGERLECGEVGEPLLEAALDARDLRLLQHHLADEHRVRVARAAPREVAVELAPLLGDERDELRRCAGC